MLRLSAKLGLIPIGIALAVGVILSWWNAVHMRHALLADLARRGELVVLLLSDPRIRGLEAGDAKETAHALRRVVESSPELEYLYVTDRDGNVLTHTFEGDFPAALLQDRSESGSEQVARRQVRLDGVPILEIDRAIGAGKKARVHAGLNTQRVTREIDQARLWIMSAALVVGLLSAAFSRLAGRKLTRSLQTFAEQITAYGRRERHQARPIDSGTAEVRMLADSIETMMRAHDQSESERSRLISILEATTDFVGTADPQGNISYVNRAGRAMTGIGDRPLAAMRISDIHPDWANEIIRGQGIPAAVRDGTWSGETALLGPGGVEIPVSQVILSHRDRTGGLSFLSTIMRDISEPRESQRRLEARDALLRRLSERVPGVIFQYLMHPDGRSCIPYASDGIREIFEVTPAEVREDAAPVFARVHPDDRDAVDQSIKRSFTDLTLWRHEYRVVLPGHGTRWLRGEAMPNRLDDGSVMWHGYVGDVTEFRLAQEANQRLASIVSFSHDLIATADMQGRVQFVNRAGLALVGLEEGARTGGMQIDDLLHESSRQMFGETVLPAVLNEGHWAGEVDVRDFRTGDPIPTLNESFRIDDPHGKPLGIATVSRDISDRKRAEQALRESEARFQTLLEVAPDPILVHVGGRYVYANPAALELLGASTPDQILGKDVLTIVHPDSHDLVNDRVRKHNRREPVAPRVEQRWRRFDGTPIEVEVTGVPFALGTQQAVHVMARDITQSKRAGEALRQSEERLRQALHISQIGIFDHDHQAKSIYWSPELRRIFGWDAEETITLSKFMDCVLPDDRAKVMAAVQHAHDPSGDGVYDIEFRVNRRDGDVRWLVGQGQTFFAGEGAGRHPVRTVGATLDITERKRVEEALSANEARLAEAQRIGRMGSWSLDLVTNKLEWSEEIFRIFEIDPAEFEASYEAFLGKVHPDDRALVDQAYSRSVRERAPYDTVHRLLMNDGRVKYVREVCETSYNDRGQAVCSMGTVQDITALRQIEEDLRRYQHQLEDMVAERTRTIKEQSQIIDQIHDAVVTTDFDGVVRSWNNGAERVFGYAAKEMLGRHFGILYPEGDAEFLREHVIAPLLRKGSHETEARVLHKSGKAFYVHQSLSLLRDDEGRPRGIVGYSIDITERKQAEEALAASEARLQMIAANVSECFYIVSPDFSKAYYVNQASEKIFGLQREEILRQPMVLLRVAHADDIPRIEAGLAALARGESFELDYRVNPDGSPERWVHVRAHPVLGYDGTPLVVGVAADITRRKQLEAERHHDELRQRDALIREVHHRVKNHLQGVIGLLWQRGSEHPELAGVIAESAGLMQTVATIYGLQGKMADRQVLLDEMLAAIVQSQAQLTGAAIDLQNSGGNSRPLVVTKDEAVPLALAINELITNAIKHSRDRRATIRCARTAGDETRASISISNAGALPADFQGDSAKRTGMGMRLLRTLLPARSGITVSHTSTPEGVVTATLLIGPPAVVRQK